MTKKDDKFKVPARESTMQHPPTALPALFKVGSLVRYWVDGDTPGSTSTGWVIQTPLMPGGQTKSYLIVPHYVLPSVINGCIYTSPVRLDADQIIEALEPELP